MKNTLLFFLFFLFLQAALFSDPLEDILQNALEEMETPDKSPMFIGLGVFHYSDKSIAGNFSSYLENKLGLVLNRTGRFELVDREKLDVILEETRFGLSGLVDENTRVEPGRLKGLQGILSGRYYDSGESVRLYLELLDLETGTIISSKEVILPKNEIPGNIHILPDNYNDALFILDELADLKNTGPGLLTVKAWTKRGNGGTYHNGENLVINFYSNNDCYIKIYHIDVRGKISLIFPNHIYSDNFITANRIYKIPDSRYNFNFELSPPFGTEFIKVISSIKQFQYIEESFEELENISEEIVSKGLRITEKEEQTTELLISYTITE